MASDRGLVCLVELAVATNSTMMPNQMLVYIDIETMREIKFAKDLSKLMTDLHGSAKERQSFIEELKVLREDLVAYKMAKGVVVITLKCVRSQVQFLLGANNLEVATSTLKWSLVSTTSLSPPPPPPPSPPTTLDSPPSTPSSSSYSASPIIRIETY
ncbi:hypothetical protein Tco_1269823 [Tanacetum coccineum]